MSFENFMNRDELLKRLREFAKNNEKTELFHQSFQAQVLADFLASSDLPTRPHDNALDYLAPIIALGVEEDAKYRNTNKNFSLSRMTGFPRLPHFFLTTPRK